jgi:hypothetical protein
VIRHTADREIKSQIFLPSNNNPHVLAWLCMPTPVLSPADLEHFVTHGFIKVPQALDAGVIRRAVDLMWTRLGYDRDDPATWTEAKIHMPNHEHFEVKDVAPRAFAAICELCGGAERIHPPTWGDGFIANFHFGDGMPWVPPGPQMTGWHKDGDFFRHFLDSPEQGLLTIVLWSDVQERGGATFLAADSVGPVARHLLDHPEGVNPLSAPGESYGGFPFKTMIHACRDFRAATGAAGDVYLMHPFLLHTSSFNALKLPRLITNPPVALTHPMRFDRPHWNDHSPVEQAVLRSLQRTSLAFSPTAPRERLEPPRVAQQRRLKESEDARIAAAKR